MNNTHLHKQNTNSYKINFEDERVDGADKVTGKAKYTAEYNLPNMAYGVFVTSSIAKGTIKNIDTSKALSSPSQNAMVACTCYSRLRTFWPLCFIV